MPLWHGTRPVRELGGEIGATCRPAGQGYEELVEAGWSITAGLSA